MPRVIVDVMLKPEILDPQGKAVRAALARLGYTGVADVRQGKRFELTLAQEPTSEAMDAIAEAAATLLANPVIEDVVSIRLDPVSAQSLDPTPAQSLDPAPTSTAPPTSVSAALSAPAPVPEEPK
jgi:phosphoribosylformylglycinamidine synthase